MREMEPCTLDKWESHRKGEGGKLVDSSEVLKDQKGRSEFIVPIGRVQHWARSQGWWGLGFEGNDNRAASTKVSGGGRESIVQLSNAGGLHKGKGKKKKKQQKKGANRTGQKSNRPQLRKF